MLVSGDSAVARGFLRLAGVVLTRPDLGMLTRLTRAFGRLPYENFTKIIRAAEHARLEDRLRLPQIVLADHLGLGAGGTCFSLTQFFREVLAHAGFESSPVLCDRSYGPETHCALIVPIGRERFLVDPGYLMEAPIPIPQRGESVQRGTAGIVTLQRLGESRQLLLITEAGGKRRIRYRMRDEPSTEERFDERWADSFGWAMMRHLCVSRNADGGQIYLRDGLLRRIRREDTDQGRVKARFEQEVERLFGIDPRIVSRAREAVLQLKAQSSKLKAQSSKLKAQS